MDKTTKSLQYMIKCLKTEPKQLEILEHKWEPNGKYYYFLLTAPSDSRVADSVFYQLKKAVTEAIELMKRTYDVELHYRFDRDVEQDTRAERFIIMCYDVPNEMLNKYRKWINETIQAIHFKDNILPYQEQVTDSIEKKLLSIDIPGFEIQRGRGENQHESLDISIVGIRNQLMLRIEIFPRFVYLSSIDCPSLVQRIKLKFLPMDSVQNFDTILSRLIDYLRDLRIEGYANEAS